jgi:hypothetical protein
MKPETMDKISELLKQEMMRAREDLLYAIEHDFKSNFDKKIAEYQDAYKAYMDFWEWREEQED